MGTELCRTCIWDLQFYVDSEPCRTIFPHNYYYYYYYYLVQYQTIVWYCIPAVRMLPVLYS